MILSIYLFRNILNLSFIIRVMYINLVYYRCSENSRKNLHYWRRDKKDYPGDIGCGFASLIFINYRE